MPNNTIDWGQGAANNSIGWGAGAVNNSLNWGKIHAESYGHDETNLTGVLSFFEEFGTPAAAFSFRDLSGNGQAVFQARRGGDNALQDFTANEIINGDLATFSNGFNVFVRTWYNQAGGQDLINTTLTEQPIIVNLGTVFTENGLPAMDFDGVSQFLRTAAFASELVQPNTIISVNNKRDHNAYLYDGISSSKRNAQGNSDWIFAGSVLSGAYPNVSLNSQVIFSALFNGNNSEAYVNSTQTATGATGTDGLTGITLGRFNNLGATVPTLNGSVQEVILFDSDESANLSGIHNNINNYYSIY